MTSVRQVLQWLRLPPDQRPHLITLYFSEVDTASHRNSLNSPNVERAARSLDAMMGVLIDGIDALPFGRYVNLVITPDDGMVETSRSRTITIESLVDLSGIEHTFDGPVSSFHVAGGDLTRAQKLRDDLNARLRNGRRTSARSSPSGITTPQTPAPAMWSWSWRSVDHEAATAKLVQFGNRGAHGWDPAVPAMRAVFLAMGPTIKPGLVIDPVDNVDVYPFMTELLGLRRATPGIDGRSGRIAFIVQK